MGDEQELMSDISNNQAKDSQRVESSGATFNIPASGLVWDEFECQCLQQALDMTQGNKSKAAKLLGISYKQFLYRLEKFNLN